MCDECRIEWVGLLRVNKLTVAEKARDDLRYSVMSLRTKPQNSPTCHLLVTIALYKLISMMYSVSHNVFVNFLLNFLISPFVLEQAWADIQGHVTSIILVSNNDPYML